MGVNCGRRGSLREGQGGIPKLGQEIAHPEAAAGPRLWGRAREDAGGPAIGGAHLGAADGPRPLEPEADPRATDLAAL